MSAYGFYIGLLYLLLSFPVMATDKIDKNYKKTPQVTKTAYIKEGSKNAVVLMSVNWGRKWGCGSFENAQLTGLGFDLVSDSVPAVTVSPDLYLQSPSKLFAKPVFTNYAFILPPGVYGISYMKIKVAKSRSDVGYLTADRSSFFKNNMPDSGNFEAKAGEVVYIGNFWIDCAFGPMPWRYFSTMDTFAEHLKEYSRQYKFIPVAQAKYRLFSSNVFSNPSDNTYGQELNNTTP